MALNRNGRGRGGSSGARLGLVILGLATLAGVGAAAARADIDPSSGIDQLPTPNLDSVEPAVAKQLEDARRELEAAVHSEEPAATVEAAYGLLGRLYFRYDFAEAAVAALLGAERLGPEAPLWPYLIGAAAMDLGDLDLARSALERTIELEPSDLASWLRLGVVAIDLNDLDSASAAFETALVLDLDAAKAYHGLAQIAQLRGDFTAAAERFERTLELQPSADQVHYELGLVYRELADLERAREHLAAYGPRGVTWQDPRIDELDQLVTGAGIHQVRGNVAFTQGLYQLAATHYRAAIEADPDHLPAWQALASALAAGGDRAGASAAYDEVLARDPDNAIAYYNLGLLALEGGNLSHAIRQFERAVEIAPDYENALVNLATALEQAARLDEAAAVASEARAALPHDAAVAALSARIDLRRQRPADARATLETIVVEAPDSAEAWFLLGVSREQLGSIDGAVEAFRRASQLEPGEPEAARREGTLLGRAGRFSDAALAFDRAIAGDPRHEETQFGRAMARLLAEEYEVAIANLESAIVERPDSLPLGNVLAQLLATCPAEELRDGPRAVELAQQAWAGQPSAEHARTMAMALAATGQFDQAVVWQERSLAEARRRGQTRTVDRMASELERYRRGEPARAPWRSD